MKKNSGYNIKYDRNIHSLTNYDILSYGRIRIVYKNTTPLGHVLNLIISILGHWDFNYMIVSSLGFITTELQLQ